MKNIEQLIQDIAESLEDSTLKGAEGIIAQIIELQKDTRSNKVTDVKISNSKDITEKLSEGLQGVIDTLKDELGKIDKEIVIKNDLSQIMALFKTNTDKKDIVKALKKIEERIPDIKIPEAVDYTLILSEIIKGIENIEAPDISEIANLLKGVLQVDLDPNLIEKDRVKVTLPKEQVTAMSTIVEQSGFSSDRIVDAVNNIITLGGGIPANKATDAYGFQADSTTATYDYFFYEDGNANWYILRLNKSTGVASYAKGTGGYQSVYVDNTSDPSGSPTFDTYEVIFDNVSGSSLSFDANGNLNVIDNGASNQDIAEGTVTGKSFLHKFGKNPDIDNASGFEAIWNGGADYTGFPSTAETMEIFSSSANDTSTGTGARTVTIKHLLDANYNEMPDVTVTLNGTTPVSLGTQTYLRSTRMKVITAGSTGSNEGTLTLRHTTTTSNIFAVMPIGYNQTMIACYTIPAGKTGYLYDWFAGLGNTVRPESSVRLLARNFGEVFTVREELEITGNGTSYIQREYNLPKNDLPEKTDIKIMADSNANNASIVGGFDLLLVTN